MKPAARTKKLGRKCITRTKIIVKNKKIVFAFTKLSIEIHYKLRWKRTTWTSERTWRNRKNEKEEKSLKEKKIRMPTRNEAKWIRKCYAHIYYVCAKIRRMRNRNARMHEARRSAVPMSVEFSSSLSYTKSGKQEAITITLASQSSRHIALRALSRSFFRNVSLFVPLCRCVSNTYTHVLLLVERAEMLVCVCSQLNENSSFKTYHFIFLCWPSRVLWIICLSMYGLCLTCTSV